MITKVHCSLTGFVRGVVKLHQEGVSIVPDLLACPGVVSDSDGLEVGVVDALAHGDVDWGLPVTPRDGQGLLPHRVHWWGGNRGREVSMCTHSELSEVPETLGNTCTSLKLLKRILKQHKRSIDHILNVCFRFK